MKRKLTHLLTSTVAVFYSARFYQEIVQYWRLRTLGFLLVFLLMVWLPVAMMQAIRLNSLVTYLATQFPTLTITKGKASTREHRPYFIYHPNTHQLLAIVDTYEPYRDFKNSSALLLVTSDHINYKTHGGKRIQRKRFDHINHTVISAHDIKNIFHHLLPIAFIVFYGLAVITCYFICLVWAVLYGIIALLISNIAKRGIDYIQSINLAAIALLPGIAFFLLLLLLGALYTWEWLLVLFIQLIYVVSAVLSLPKKLSST